MSPVSQSLRASCNQNLCHQARFPEKDPTGLNVSGPIGFYFEGVKDLCEQLFCGTALKGLGSVSDCLGSSFTLILLGG